jgi:hypothetical protein
MGSSAKAAGAEIVRLKIEMASRKSNDFNVASSRSFCSLRQTAIN